MVTQGYERPGAPGIVDWRPVAFTARAWTEIEKRYSQIEKESLALYSGIVTNRTYLLGAQFEAAVYHRPLLPLYNNPKRPTQMRVARHRIKLAGYNLKVIHVASTHTPSDYGTRGGCPKARDYTEEEVEEYGVDTDQEIYVNRVMTENIPDAMSQQRRGDEDA